MPKLNKCQKKVANQQIVIVENRIQQLQKMIQGQNVSQLKRGFIGQQIKQLNVIKQSLVAMIEAKE